MGDETFRKLQLQNAINVDPANSKSLQPIAVSNTQIFSGEESSLRIFFLQDPLWCW